MLFQPTNITPSSFAGVGGDLIDASDGMTITWQVNGTSAMTGYEITIYENDAQSTQLYTTGHVTISPFYGMDGMGNPQLYSVTIPAATLSTAGIENGDGDGYKYKIIQYWSTTDYVEQSAENYFIAQSSPTCDITTNYLYTPNDSITASWSQSDGVGLDWVRWQVTELNSSELLIDTGKIHTQVMELEYSGWVNGKTYNVLLTYQLQNGYTGSATGLAFAEWTDVSQRGDAQAFLVEKCSAALVSFPIPTYAEVSNAGSVTATVVDGVLNVPSGETLSWVSRILSNTQGRGYLVWSGTPIEGATLSINNVSFETIAVSADLYAEQSGENTATIGVTAGSIVATDEGNGIVTITASNELYTETDGAGSTYMYISGSGSSGLYIMGTFAITVYPNGRIKWEATSTSSQSGMMVTGESLVGKEVTVIMGGTYWYIGVYNSATGTTNVYTFPSPCTELVINPAIATPTISLSGQQECNFIGFTNGELMSYTVSQLTSGEHTQPAFDGSWLFLSDFADYSYQSLGSFNDISWSGVSPSVSSITVYRIKDGSSIMQKIATITNMSKLGKLVDYGVVSSSSYSYAVQYDMTDSESSSTGAYTVLLNTNAVTPCYWDWLLTEAAYNAEDETYHMVATYRFGLNLATEAMSNNNIPALLQNFTRYPTRQPMSANYRTGVLTAYIGSVDGKSNMYVDTAAQADAIMALGASTNAKFLRSRKGEMWKVDTSTATTVQVGDKYKEQPYVATWSWVETGPTDDVSVISIPTDAEWAL